MSELLEDLQLIDHHCHGLDVRDLDRLKFEALLSEGGSAPAQESRFDTPLGVSVRRHCAPVLDLEPHAAPDTYLARRSELGSIQVARRFLQAADIARFYVDTGFHGDDLTAPADLGALAGRPAYEVVRLETVAESVAASGVEPSAYDEAFTRALEDAVRAADVVGVKSIAAYRTGFDLDPAPPASDDVEHAAREWLSRGPGTNGWRMDNAVLTRHLLWRALDLGRPLQLHVGFGDPDVRLHRSDPSLLTELLQAAGPRSPVLLLHNYPFHRNAGYLAAVFPNVYFDVGLTLSHVGPVRGHAILAEALEIAPFSRMLFSSDAFGLAELYYVGAVTFRLALGTVLDQRVRSGEWASSDARRVATMIGFDNAERVYGGSAAGA